MNQGENEWEMCGRAAGEMMNVCVWFPNVSSDEALWGLSVLVPGELYFLCVSTVNHSQQSHFASLISTHKNTHIMTSTPEVT